MAEEGAPVTERPSQVISGEQLPDYDADTLLISFSRGVCFGQCPVEAMAIFQSGEVVFHGGRFSQRPGLHRYFLSEQELLDLQDLLGDFSIRNYEERFGMEVSDISSKTIGMQDEKGHYQIEFKGTTDKILSSVVERLVSLIIYDRMKLIEK